MTKSTISHNHLSESFYSMPQLASQMMTRKQWQETMLATNGRVLAQGRTWILKCKHRGGGVYDVTVDLKQY